MLKENIKLYIYKFSEANMLYYYRQISDFLIKNDCSGCKFKNANIGIVYILNKDLGNLLIVPNWKTKPFIGKCYKKFIGKYKKRSKNTFHMAFNPFGKDGGALIKHYAESMIINNRT